VQETTHGNNAVKRSAFRWLRCPSCHEGVHSAATGTGADVQDYDLLVCGCRQYPVVAGIPILQTGRLGTADNYRASADEVISLIQAGRHRDALLCMILPRPPAPPTAAPAWIRALPSMRGIGRLKTMAHRWGLRTWREQMAAWLADAGGRATACELLDSFYRRSGLNDPDRYHHFACRFGQPRHLVALSFASLIQQPQQPILELCCGFGHLTRSLTARSGGQSVIAMDRDFFALYVAKTCIAPEANYVCADASQPLPFPDDIFSTLCCVDGLHYVRHKDWAIQECKRVLGVDGLLMLVASRNARIEYQFAGEPLPPEGYQALVADMPHCLMADRDVLHRYLQREGPPLAHSISPERLADAPLLSVVASRRQEVFRDHGRFADWPHAEGSLRLNPLYREERRDHLGNVYFRCAFPSPFYAQDNPEYSAYLPEQVCVDAQVLRDLRDEQRTPAVERLIEQYVVLGMPARYY
jgi:ubiquinone/menaquinone biosynthesis C-methylase UbiE